MFVPTPIKWNPGPLVKSLSGGSRMNGSVFLGSRWMMCADAYFDAESGVIFADHSSIFTGRSSGFVPLYWCSCTPDDEARVGGGARH